MSTQIVMFKPIKDNGLPKIIRFNEYIVLNSDMLAFCLPIWQMYKVKKLTSVALHLEIINSGKGVLTFKEREVLPLKDILYLGKKGIILEEEVIKAKDLVYWDTFDWKEETVNSLN